MYRPRPAASKSNERETSLAFFKKKMLKNFKRKPLKSKHRKPMVKLGAHNLPEGECNNLILNMSKENGTPESRQNKQPGIFDRSAITINSETFAILKDQGQQADFAPLSGNRSNVLSSRRDREAHVDKNEYAAIMMGISGIDASTNKTRSSRRKLNDILDEENIKSIQRLLKKQEVKANIQNNTHGDHEKTLVSPKELRDTCSLSESAFPIEIQNLRNVDRCKSSLNETPFSGMQKSS